LWEKCKRYGIPSNRNELDAETKEHDEEE
jgi:hypothetical protein